MKLTERSPRWVDSGDRKGVGVSFDCPSCSERHWVPFDNPIDAGPCVYPQGGWKRTGDTFDTLTLTPSIIFWDSTGPGNGTWAERTDWHGFIRNGELVTCR